MDFVSTSLWLCVLLTAFAGLFIYVAMRSPDSKNKIFSIRFAASFFAIMYILLGHLALVTAVGQSLFLTYRAPCENIVVNSTQYNETKNIYDYVDSCEGDPIPYSSETIYKLTLYLFLADILGILIGGIYFLGNKLFRWL